MSDTQTTSTPITADTSTSATSGVSKAVRISSIIQLVAATGLIVLVFLEWVRLSGGGGKIGLAGSGGGGFAVLALITAVVTFIAAAQGLAGRRAPRPVFGVNQLAVALAVGLFFANLVFLWVFSTGGAPKWVYPAANILAYAGIVGLFADRPDQAAPMDDGVVRTFGGITAAVGVAIMAAPALGYTQLASRTLTGYQPGAPRVGVAMLLFGAIIVFLGVQRARRGAAMADVGPYVLYPHITMMLGTVVTAIPFAWVVSGLWGNDFDPGIGAYLSVVAGAALFGVGAVEASRRRAPGI